MARNIIYFVYILILGKKELLNFPFLFHSANNLCSFLGLMHFFYAIANKTKIVCLLRFRAKVFFCLQETWQWIGYMQII